jgi:hypothetical protein
MPRHRARPQWEKRPPSSTSARPCNRNERIPKTLGHSNHSSAVHKQRSYLEIFTLKHYKDMHVWGDCRDIRSVGTGTFVNRN